MVQFFDWTPDLAYVVGLIATDGCLSSDNKCMVFTSGDIEQIGNVKLILHSPGKICYTRNSKSEAYRIYFCNVQFYDWLLGIGLTPNKSLTLGELRIPHEYFIDFLRGHLDGDGSITTYTDRYNTKVKSKYVYERLCVRFISASKAHMLWLKGMITAVTGLKGSFHATKLNTTGNRIYLVKFGKKESLKLLSQIYYRDYLPCLTRKKSLYLDFLLKMDK